MTVFILTLAGEDGDRDAAVCTLCGDPVHVKKPVPGTGKNCKTVLPARERWGHLPCAREQGGALLLYTIFETTDPFISFSVFIAVLRRLKSWFVFWSKFSNMVA